MSRVLESTFKSSLSEPSLKLALLVRFQFIEGDLAFSSTVHSIDFNGVTYLGFGNLGSVSKLNEGEVLDPQVHEVTISGIKPTIASAIISTKWMNRVADCYLASLNSDGQIIGTPSLYFKGNVSNVNGVIGSKNSITLTIKDELALWNTPRKERYTNEDQQARYPGDKGFEFVAELAEKMVTWPAKEWFKNNG